MEQKLGEKSFDIKLLGEFCEREGNCGRGTSLHHRPLFIFYLSYLQIIKCRQISLVVINHFIFFISINQHNGCILLR